MTGSVPVPLLALAGIELKSSGLVTSAFTRKPSYSAKFAYFLVNYLSSFSVSKMA